ncbi:M24 family metallopeptidase [Caviibacter abscessus]|uniref:M24 family metallopeptidase n=1 Tax=Caviibacter abscessus TaxID=1766719 RepID=UPI00082B914C|nr:Xaa-Pro peptidase family protein [Caviibacter abscessus]
MDKISSIRQYISEEKLTGVIITNPTNVFYLTGFSCNPHERLLALVITEDKLCMLVPALEYETAKLNVTKNIQIASYFDTEDGYAKLQVLSGNLNNIGIEKSHLTVERLERILEIFDVKTYENIDKLIINMRKYKSEDEVLKLREATRLSDIAIDIARKNLKEGITELELKSIIEYEMKKLGVKSMSFETIVLFGKNAANPHGESGTTKLQKGDLALFDLGVYYNGYASDETRTFKFGEVSEEANKIYETVLKANTAAINACKPGIRFCDLDKIARDIITEAGYGQYFTHRLGHGLGIDVHEFPDVSSSTKDILEEGMVFTIEPGIYKPGVAGVRIEDDILITKDGCEVLTKYEK